MKPCEKPLTASGAKHFGAVLETNSFFDTPDKSLLAQDKGLRLRRTRDQRTGEEHFVITVKGPAQPGLFKSREEAETDVDDGAAPPAYCRHSDSSPSSPSKNVAKAGRSMAARSSSMSLPILGRFVEVEGPDEPSVMRVRERLGLSSLPSIKTGYISILSRHLQETADPRKSITF